MFIYIMKFLHMYISVQYFYKKNKLRKLFLCLSSQTKFCSLKQWRTSKNKKSFQVDDKVLKRQITKFYLYDHIVEIYFWSHFSYNDTYLDGIISTSYHFLHTLHSSTKNIYKEIFFFQTCLIPGKVWRKM